MVGVFKVVDEMPEEQQLRLIAVTCPSLLYATAREVIAFLTARGPNGTFLLPSVSFTDLALKPQQAAKKAGSQRLTEPAKG